MKLKCLSTTIPLEFRRQAGLHDRVSPEYQVTIGKLYEPYGMAVPFSRSRLLRWTIFYILNDQDRFTIGPEYLFEIVDCTAPPKWEIRVNTDSIEYGYPLVHENKLLESLSDGSLHALKQLKKEASTAVEDQPDQ